MKYYSYNGSVEGDRYAEEIIKKQRIQRLQEVRKYGSKLSRDRCKVYNEKLNQRLRLKGELARDARVEDLKSEYNTVLNRFKKALVDNGQAHRDALDNAVITIHKFEAQQEVKEYKEAAIAERGQEALVKRKKQIVLVKQKKERLKKNREAVVERSKSDREHAKASAESREAKAKAEKKRMDLVDNGPLVIDQDHSTNSASSAKLMQKGGFSAVKAKVMKHGATRADISIVNNTATVAAIDSLKKRMDRCLDEMKNKLRAKARAKKAIQVEVQKHKVDSMENELQLLHTIDKGGLRVSRVKTSAAVKSSEESPAVAQAFESAFLSRPQEDEVYTDDSSVDTVVEGFDEEEEEEEEEEEMTVTVQVTHSESDDDRNSKVRFNQQLEQGQSTSTVSKGAHPGVLKGSTAGSSGSSLATSLSSQPSQGSGGGPPAGPVGTTAGTASVVPSAPPAYTAGGPIASGIPKPRGPPRKSPPRQDRPAAHRVAYPRSTNDVDISIVDTNENEIRDSMNFSTASHAAPSWAPHPTFPGGFGTGSTALGGSQGEDDMSVNFEEMADFNADEGLSVTSSDYQMWEDSLAYPQGGSGSAPPQEGDLSAADVLSQHMSAYGIGSTGGAVDDVEMSRRSESPLDFTEALFNQTIGKPGKARTALLSSISDLRLNALPLGLSDDEGVDGSRLGLQLGLDTDGMTNPSLKYENFYSPGTDSVGNWSQSQRHSMESATLSTASTINARHDDDDITTSNNTSYNDSMDRGMDDGNTSPHGDDGNNEMELQALEDEFVTAMASASRQEVLKEDKSRENSMTSNGSDDYQYHDQQGAYPGQDASFLSEHTESNGDDGCFNVSSYEPGSPQYEPQSSHMDASTIDTSTYEAYYDDDSDGEVEVIYPNDDGSDEDNSDSSATVTREREVETGHNSITASPPYQQPPITTITTAIVGHDDDTDITLKTTSRIGGVGADHGETYHRADQSPYRHDSGIDSDDELPVYADRDGTDRKRDSNVDVHEYDHSDDGGDSDDDLPVWAGGASAQTVPIHSNDDGNHSTSNGSDGNHSTSNGSGDNHSTSNGSDDNHSTSNGSIDSKDSIMEMAKQASILEHVKMLVESEKQAIDCSEVSDSGTHQGRLAFDYDDHGKDDGYYGDGNGNTELDADGFIDAFLAEDPLHSHDNDEKEENRLLTSYGTTSSISGGTKGGGYGTIDGSTSPVTSPVKGAHLGKDSFSIHDFIGKYTQSESDDDRDNHSTDGGHSHSYGSYDDRKIDSHTTTTEESHMSPLKQALGVRNSMEYKALLSQRLRTALVQDSDDSSDEEESMDFRRMLSPIKMPRPHARAYGGRATSYIYGTGVMGVHENDEDISMSSLDASNGVSRTNADAPHSTTNTSHIGNSSNINTSDTSNNSNIDNSNNNSNINNSNSNDSNSTSGGTKGASKHHQLHTEQLMMDIDASKNRLLEHVKASLYALHRPREGSNEDNEGADPGIEPHQPSRVNSQTGTYSGYSNHNSTSHVNISHNGTSISRESLRESVQSIESDASSLSYYPLDTTNSRSVHSDIDISVSREMRGSREMSDSRERRTTSSSGSVSLATTITERSERTSVRGNDSNGSLSHYPLAQLSQLSSNSLNLSHSFSRSLSRSDDNIHHPRPSSQHHHSPIAARQMIDGDGDDHEFSTQIDGLVEQYLSSTHSGHSDGSDIDGSRWSSSYTSTTGGNNNSNSNSNSDQILSEGDLSTLHVDDDDKEQRAGGVRHFSAASFDDSVGSFDDDDDGSDSDDDDDQEGGRPRYSI